MTVNKLLIGTSGWHYSSWLDSFYPKNLNKNKWLQYYSEFFNTVEVNSSFYHLVKDEVFKKWFEQTPDNFKFCVKASRYITHIKKLIDCAEPFKRLLDSACKLEHKLELFLFQMPPNMKKDIERLNIFLKSIPGNYKYVFEFRNESWFTKEVYEMLDEYGAAITISDSPDFPHHEVITGSICYIRMHGSTQLYSSKYSKEELEKIRDIIKNNLKKDIATYIYFNNDAFCNAIKNARELLELTENL